MKSTIKNEQIKQIHEYASFVRQYILETYGQTSGKCISATDLLHDILSKNGYKVFSINVFVLYEKFESCTYYCYEEHWLNYVLINGRRIYIDTTMDQFQWAFSKKLPNIYISGKLPNFYLRREPGKTTLDRCGWNEWIKYGDYKNNFDYWG